ncbi:MAG: phage holin family protein [Lentisphaeria bacterium]|nr:phage holin family protein [Lentisphaeria bacterium]
MKHAICAAIGAAGSFIAGALGGWDTAIITLCSFMAIDYVTGFIVAGVFHKSKKSDSGGLKSHEGWKGLCKKGMILLLVVVANLLDKQIGASYARDAVCIFFMVNEGVSILENAALMGIPIPKWLSRSLDILQSKVDDPV